MSPPKNIFSSLKIAKNQNITSLPPEMTLNNTSITKRELPDVFAFDLKTKVEDILNDTEIKKITAGLTIQARVLDNNDYK